jgi:dynein heavy chain
MEKTIETCIRLNVPCLIEDANEEIPAFLDQLLMK